MKIQKFISEKENELFDLLLNTKNKTLMVSPMKSGKTTFVMKDLYEILRELEVQLIFITPKVSLMDNLKAKYPNSQLCKENLLLSHTFSHILTLLQYLLDLLKVERVEQSLRNIKTCELHHF